MWEFITLTISSTLAIIGASLNTEKDNKGVKKTILKKPNSAGWAVIVLLVCLTLIQVFLQIEKNINSNVQKNRIRRDSINIAALMRSAKEDSLTFVQQLDLANKSYLKQIEALETSNSILLETNRVNKRITENFKKNFEEFDNVLHQTNSLLNPILPMVIKFQLKIPFSNEWMDKYVTRITNYKDSISKSIKLYDLGGLNRISMDGNRFEVVDSLSNFNINSLDGVAQRFLNPGYYVYFYSKKPPRYHYNTQEDLMLEATKKTTQPWPSSPFGNGSMFLDFNNKFVYLTVFYKIDNYPNKAKLKGLNDLPDKYLLISSAMPNKDYEILSVTFFTGTNFSNYTKIKLDESECISDQKFPAGSVSSTKDYLHKITLEDLK